MNDRKKGLAVLTLALVLMVCVLITLVIFLLKGQDRKLTVQGTTVMVKRETCESEAVLWEDEAEVSASSEVEAVSSEADRPSNETDTSWSPDSLREGLTTVIEYDKQYSATIPSKEEAGNAIREYGIMQREKYFNPATEAIELQMEEEYGIFAVNMGEIDEATALDVKRAVAYMYETYPQIRGTLTNISLGNFEGQKVSNIAVTQSREFMLSGELGQCPYVVKHEIILNAAKFTNREKMMDDCEYQVAIGHWPENTDISSIVVHELGHHLLDVIAMEHYGLKDAYYITEQNEDAYILFSSDMLADNQTVAKSIMADAYAIWQDTYSHAGTEDEFRKSISGYAEGIQDDGGISYGETFAESIADVYLNKDAAADASKAIVAVANKRLDSD